MLEPENRQDNKSPDAAPMSTEERILDAARAEFAQYGQAGARVDRIARTAGVNKAMIYYHFKSKDGLYVAVIRAFYERAARLIQQQAVSSKSVEELLASLADVYSRVLCGFDAFRSILMRQLANPQSDVIDQVAAILSGSGIVERALGLIEQGVQNGKVRQVDARQAMVSFVTMNIGYYLIAPVVDKVLGLTDPADKEKFLEERKKIVVDIFLNGIKASK